MNVFDANICNNDYGNICNNDFMGRGINKLRFD